MPTLLALKKGEYTVKTGGVYEVSSLDSTDMLWERSSHDRMMLGILNESRSFNDWKSSTELGVN